MDSGEGKSFTSLNIATSFALLKKRSILVNMDLRADNNIYSEMETGFGMSAYLDDLADIDEIIVPSSNMFLDFIPAGASHQHASELFTDNKLAPLIGELKKKYDYIIIDSPPLGKIADPLIISKHTNLNLIVVRINYTLKEHIAELEQLFVEGKISNAGLVLNDIRLSKYQEKHYYYRKNSPPKKPKRKLFPS
jgi:capsular exopolysaccharide synthesis family protein